MSCLTVLNGAKLPEGFCAHVFHPNLNQARGLYITENNDILVLARGGTGRVLAIIDDDEDLIAESTVVIAEQSGLNHGLAVDGGYLYASSSSTVYRWTYTPGQRTQSTNPEIVVKNMNSQGCSDCGAPQGHSTRTLVFDAQGRLYISVGSAYNVDADSYRSRIRRFNLSSIPSGGIEFSSGEVFADGLRNEVGLAFDKHGVLWGVENGADNLNRPDLGGDIHKDNPAEELNRFPEEDAGKHYGYPFCFSEYILPSQYGEGPGTIWAWPSFMSSGTTDQWCRENTLPPALTMQAHSAPLGITFMDGQRDLTGCNGSFPSFLDGTAFIGFHGSWNRNPSTGYKVTYVPMDESGMPNVTSPIDILAHSGTSANWPNGFRPVDVKFDKCNRLLVTSDAGTSVSLVMITYEGLPSVLSPGNGTPPCNCTSPPTSASSQEWELPVIISSVAVGLIAVAALILFLRQKGRLPFRTNTRDEENK